MACGSYAIFRFPYFWPLGRKPLARAAKACILGGLPALQDLRRAKAALSTALDPQGSGSLVGWDNPDSGNKGSFTPVGKPFPVEAGVCRVFLAEVNRKGACSDERGEWTIAEAKPWKKT